MNLEALALLKSADRTNQKPAYLKRVGQDTALYYFLYNPSEYSDSITANYSEVASLTASIPYLDYNNSSGITREFSDLLIDTYEDRRSFREIIMGLKSLMIADVANGEYEPSDLEFYWGSEILKPVKLLDFKYRIDSFLGGEPARGVVSLTFKEIPTFDPSKKEGKTSETSNNSNLVTKNQERVVNTSYPDRINLTDRQIFEGLAVVKSYLQSNTQKYSATIKKLIQTKNYNLEITVGGIVWFYRKGDTNPLQKIGTYNGRKFVEK